MLKTACIIPTFNGKSDLTRLLASLKEQKSKFNIFIADSGSTDGTRELVELEVGSVMDIPTIEFNHGGTRQLMVDCNPTYDVYIFLTQDAILADDYSIEKLVDYFSDSRVGAVCGCQLPHLNATPYAEHARCFNYPPVVQVKTFEDVPKFGIKTAFMSNSFAAYRKEALQEIGGFPNHVIFGEDMYAAAKLLIAGWKVVYAADAKCRHSHNYTLSEEFRRYFDMGVFHSREPWIREAFGGAGGEGISYVWSELRFLGLRRMYLWPIAMIRNIAKLVGYKIGQQESKLPIRVKRVLGMHKRYWDGPCALAESCHERAQAH